MTEIRKTGALHIEELVVPAVVRNASRSSVILDCEYGFESYERNGLVVKWFWNLQPEAVYQWIPGKKPKALGVLRGRVNLSYRASSDEAKRHRALEILEPTTDLTGNYMCMVSSFHDEVFASKNMTVYAPATGMNLTYHKPDYGRVNLTCEAEGLFPEPMMKLYRHIDDNNNEYLEEAVVTTVLRDHGGFDISLHATLEDANLSRETVFGCIVLIPNTDYKLRRQTIYDPGYDAYGSYGKDSRVTPGHPPFIASHSVTEIVLKFSKKLITIPFVNEEEQSFALVDSSNLSIIQWRCKVCERRKLKINVGKSKVMRYTRGESDSRLEVSIKGEKLEEVNSFRYFGANVTGKGGVWVEVECRLREASKCLGGLKSVMRNRHLGMDAKRRLYEGVIVPTALYGTETWNMTEEERRSLNVLEMKCLRSMIGVTRLDRVRNEEVRRRTGVERELGDRVDERVLGWFGHMERMSEERLVKEVWNAEVEGVNMRGHPRMRWMDGVKGALQKKKNVCGGRTGEDRR
ncbi:uncharacterized protein LOC143023538 isoform X2 [Oratosquilla oratoria]|uniref:uncharacterized protein LOC143023538 isoform X2 n=1 Tax=Oratosquilla oratoria TaxID=337810 RepID=UPI003F76EA1D